jgi:hypothetical protein
MSYPRIINETNIQFKNEGRQVLCKGIKYNLHPEHNNSLETLSIVGETAIRILQILEQNN